MWIETTIENHLDEKVEVREGHGGVFSTVKLLRKGESFKVRYDMNSTYRKYMIVGPGGVVEILTSEDIIENGAVKVVKSRDEQGNVEGWNLELCKRLHKTQFDNSDDASHGPSSWRNKMHRLLGKGN